MNTQRKAGIALLLGLCLAWSGVAAHAADLPADHAVQVHLDGASVCAGQTQIIADSTYVPLRAFCAAFGIHDVRWDEDAATATVTDNGLSLRAVAGAQYLEVNGRCFWAPDGVRVLDGTLYVPIRPLARALGLAVEWNEAEQRVVLTDTGAGYAAPASAVYAEDELYWLSRIISAESRGEPLTGQLAVGNVVLNRVADPTFPDTIYGVIFDTRFGVQFSPISNGTVYDNPADISVVAAKMALEGYTISSEILYFLNAALASNFWVPQNRPFAVTVGSHDFYT